MNRSATSRTTTLRYWGPTAIAGTIATAAVALLMSTVAGAAALSGPSTQHPVEPGSGSTGIGVQSPTAVYCFMGRDSWETDLVGPQPTCGR